MASTPRSMQADPRFDDGMTAEEVYADIEHALARLVDASYPSDARAPGWGSDRSADAHNVRSSAAETLDAGDLGAVEPRPPIPRAPRSRGTRDALTRDAIAVCLVAAAIWAWRSYSDAAPEQATAPPASEMAAPPPTRDVLIAQPTTSVANGWGPASAERKQVETGELAGLRQTVAQLAAGQEQLTRAIAKLQAEKPQADGLPAATPPAEKPDKHMPRRVSAYPAPPRRAPFHPVQPVAAAARKPDPATAMPPQAARQVATASALSRAPAPQIPSQTQSSNSLRPPMPVP